ncbi:hypothetical protein KKC17_04150 [Patescibacteria group bacterium]|nr:hypothetical protein [Patescibacteria group bacterium]
MNNLKINQRMIDTITVLIKVLATSPTEFSRYITGYFSKVNNLEEQEDLFFEFYSHLSLLIDEKNHSYFELGSDSLKDQIGQALINFVNNSKLIPNNRFAKKFITRLVDYCHSGHYSSVVVDAHPLAISLGFYS